MAKIIDYETVRHTTVRASHRNEPPKPHGMCEIIGEASNGMCLVDACLPESIARILAALFPASPPITQS